MANRNEDGYNKTTNDFIAQCGNHMRCGNYKEALTSIENIRQSDPNYQEVAKMAEKVKNLKKKEGVASGYIEKKNYKKALEHIDTILKDVTDCARIKMMKAESLLFINGILDAERFLHSLKLQPEDENEAGYVKALIEFYKGNLQKAMELCEEPMKTNEYNQSLKNIYYKMKWIQGKIKEGKEEFKATNYSKAYVTYSDVINEIDQNNKALMAILLLHRIAVSLELNTYIDAVQDCRRVIATGEKLTEAYMQLAESYSKMTLYDMAIKELKNAPQNNSKVAAKIRELEQKLTENYRILSQMRRNPTPEGIISAAGGQTDSAKDIKTLQDLKSTYTSVLNRCPSDEKATVNEILELITVVMEKMATSNHNQNRGRPSKEILQSLLEKLQATSRSPEEVGRLEKPGAKDEEIEKIIKTMIKKYTPDNFPETESKRIADEILKILKEVLDKLKQAKKAK